MAKITLKADLDQNVNLFLHIADWTLSDITVADVDGTALTLTSAAGDFTVASGPDANGVYQRAIEIGDEITLSHTDNVANEGLVATVTNVVGGVISADKTSAHTTTAEANGANFNIIATKKTFQFIEAGTPALSFVDGVQGIVLASKLVDMWDTLDLDKYARPFTSIEPRAKSIAAINGWEPHDTSTLNAIRDTALEIRPDANSAASKIYALWRSGDLDGASDQFNFWPITDAAITAPTAAVMSGYINQLFLIYDVAGADNRGIWFTRCAEVGKTIVMEQHSVQYAEIIPVSSANQVDPKLQATDGAITTASSIWELIDITDDALDYSGDVDGAFFNFDLVVEGDSQKNQTVHEKINYLLRQPTDINQGNGGVLRGDKQWPITSFSGEVFTVQGYLLNYNATQRNDLRVVDTTPTTHSWPSTLAITVTAPLLAQGGTFTIYHADTYGTDGAVVFQNELDVNQQDITIAASVQIIMAYSTYNVDGHVGGQPLDIILAYNKPGSIEPDIIFSTLNGSNLTISISPTADPSYQA